MKRGLGRRFALDTRDGDFLLKNVTPAKRPKRKTWRLSQRLDQGNSPHCVGYAWKGFLLSAPRQISAPAQSGSAIYRGALYLDEWPGENYEGTSVRGGARYLTENAKLVKSYRWAFSAEDALDAVGNHGPVVLGTDWKSGMSNPDDEGIIKFSGSDRGGHAYLLLGYSDIRGLALIQNSWGVDYGLNGRAWISYEDLEEAIRAAGEACMALEIPR